MSLLLRNLFAGAVCCASDRAHGAGSAALRRMLLLCLGFCWPLHEALADLMLHPTRIVLEKNVRAAQVDLINNGDEPATYRISFINRRMNATGEFTEVDVPQPGELFSESLIRYSPRQVTLAPGVAQTVRILLRKPADLAPGEYRSHLLFQRVAEGQEKPAEGAGRATAGNELEIRLKAMVSVSIPVIVRHGETSATAQFDELELKKGPSGEPLLAFDLRRSGNRSLYGDIIVTFSSGSGAQVGVARANGVAVYSPNASRRASLALKPPPGAQLARGTLHVVFKERPDDGGKVLAERTLQLP
jgi:P pilus assembly chaperone PapD